MAESTYFCIDSAKDKVLLVAECIVFCKKYNTESFVLTKEYAETLNQKISVFKAATKTNKQILLTLISAFGLKHNQHSLGLIQQVLTLDDLFRE